MLEKAQWFFPGVCCVGGSSPSLRVYDHQGAWKLSLSSPGQHQDRSWRSERGLELRIAGLALTAQALPYLTIFMAVEEVNRSMHIAEGKVQL